MSDMEKQIQELHDDIHAMPKIPTQPLTLLPTVWSRSQPKDWKVVNGVAFDLNMVFAIRITILPNTRKVVVVIVTETGHEIMLWSSRGIGESAIDEAEIERKRILKTLGFVGE